ncbi:uncharacterized protein LOC144053524 isoform X2 [Vanacampus margaritifer]
MAVMHLNDSCQYQPQQTTKRRRKRSTSACFNAGIKGPLGPSCWTQHHRVRIPINIKMSNKPEWHSMRQRYEHQFPPANSREVTVHRGVNANFIFEKSSYHPPPAMVDYERGYENEQWYEDGPGYHGEEIPRDYPPETYYDENPKYGSFHRHAPPHHQESHYQGPHYGRDDLRHQLRSRKNGRPGPYFNIRGRRNSQNRDNHNHFRHSQNVKADWDRSSGKKKEKSQPPPKKNASPESDKGSAHPPKTNKPVVVPSPTPSVPAEEPPQTSSVTKEIPCDPVPEKESDPSNMEPGSTQDEEIKTRRSEAIKAKALDIEKSFRQDCETFVTVVKMLVTKEPTLETLLTDALIANLSEIKQNCFAALRLFIEKLNEAQELPESTT